MPKRALAPLPRLQHVRKEANIITTHLIFFLCDTHTCSIAHCKKNHLLEQRRRREGDTAEQREREMVKIDLENHIKMRNPKGYEEEVR
jgi:hypothetical protein